MAKHDQNTPVNHDEHAHQGGMILYVHQMKEDGEIDETDENPILVPLIVRGDCKGQIMFDSVSLLALISAYVRKGGGLNQIEIAIGAATKVAMQMAATSSIPGDVISRLLQQGQNSNQSQGATVTDIKPGGQYL